MNKWRAPSRPRWRRATRPSISRRRREHQATSTTIEIARPRCLLALPPTSTRAVAVDGRPTISLAPHLRALDTVGLTLTKPPLQMVRAYALEAKRALAAVHSASRAALSLQRDIARTKAAYQKEDATSTISGSSFSPVTAADFMVQVLILSSLSQAFPADRFIAEETGAEATASVGRTASGTRTAQRL